MLKLRMIVFLGLLLALFSMREIEKARACTDTPYTLQMVIDESDYVVAGRFTEVDQFNAQGFFSVDAYLSGGIGSARLFISHHTAAFYKSKMQRYDILCGVPSYYINTHARTVMGVKRHSDGSYHIVRAYYFDNAGNPIPSEYSRHYFRDDAWRLPYDVLLRSISRRSHMVASPPQSDSPLLPFAAPMIAITDSKSAYLIPMDGQVPLKIAENVERYTASQDAIAIITETELFTVGRRYDYDLAYGNILSYRNESLLCLEAHCAAFSADGVWFAYIIQPGRLYLCQTSPLLECDLVEDKNVISGFAFSPTRNVIALWRDNTLQIYEISKHDDDPPILTLLSETEVSSANEFAGTGVWSGNGRLFAYSDDSGLWLWDIYSADREPRLLISEPETAAVPIEFSPQGNYISVSSGTERYILDTETGEQRLPYGQASPDDQWLIAIEPTDIPLNNRFIVMDLLNPTTEGRFANFGVVPIFVFSDSFLALACYGEAPYTCHPFRSYFGAVEYDFALQTFAEFCSFEVGTIYDPDGDEPTWFYGEQFDYEPLSELIVVRNNATTISIGEIGANRCHSYITLNLASYLDGEIVSVEWLPSLFYEQP